MAEPEQIQGKGIKRMRTSNTTAFCCSFKCGVLSISSAHSTPLCGERRVAVIPRMAVAVPPRPPLRPSPGSSPLPPEPEAHSVVGKKELERVLSGAGDALVVVIFVASWCRVCKTLQAKVRRVAAAHPDIVWLKVDLANHPNRSLCTDLGVRMLPTFHFYRRAKNMKDSIEKFTAGPFGVKRLKEHLQLHT